MEQVSPRDTAFVFSSLYFNSLYFIHSPSLARSYALDIVCLLTCLLVFCFCCYLVQLSSLIVLPFFNLDNWFHFICLLYGFFAIVRHTSFHARWHSSIGCPAEFLVSYNLSFLLQFPTISLCRNRWSAASSLRFDSFANWFFVRRICLDFIVFSVIKYIVFFWFGFSVYTIHTRTIVTVIFFLYVYLFAAIRFGFIFPIVAFSIVFFRLFVLIYFEFAFAHVALLSCRSIDIIWLFTISVWR